jgi:hypothetical protein
VVARAHRYKARFGEAGRGAAGGVRRPQEPTEAVPQTVLGEPDDACWRALGGLDGGVVFIDTCQGHRSRGSSCPAQESMLRGGTKRSPGAMLWWTTSMVVGRPSSLQGHTPGAHRAPLKMPPGGASRCCPRERSAKVDVNEWLSIRPPAQQAAPTSHFRLSLRQAPLAPCCQFPLGR